VKQSHCNLPVTTAMAKAKSKTKRKTGVKPGCVVEDARNAEAVEVFNRGLAIQLEWGPEMARDVRVRIAEAIPGLGPRRIDALVKEFGPIISQAHRVVYEQVEKHQTEDDGRRAVAAIDRRLSADNVATLYTQARYSAWRDGLA
jgi:hypothetical protein